MQPDTDEPPPLDELEAAVHRSPGDAGAWCRLAFGYSAEDMDELAVELLTHAVRLAPRDADVFMQFGFALIEAGRSREAIASLQEAARLDPDGVPSRTFDVGCAFAASGDNATAADHFRKALDLDPRMRVAWMRLAYSLFADARYAEAIPAFEKATQYRPSSPRLWAELGVAYANTGETVKAIQACRVSLRIDPAQHHVLLELGASYLRLERLEHAPGPSQADESHEKHAGGHP